ncbi:hypothetical protein Glove_367g24 [Diversispora epigaea]|uniref:Uncharacterized protein n=1 Tax=Diversispora epigaea TaxID=1348612 RepID=A0A397HEP1_9GLOM|nr:hypothetical protein Glove_367g24 [Diversispora epigaea]
MTPDIPRILMGGVWIPYERFKDVKQISRGDFKQYIMLGGLMVKLINRILKSTMEKISERRNKSGIKKV